MNDDAVICVNCGCAVDTAAVNAAVPAAKTDRSGLDLAIKIFMIIGCVFEAFYFLIPLCWCIPMTLYLFNKRKSGEPVGVGFKVCVLLFVNLIAGILLLCRNED